MSPSELKIAWTAKWRRALDDHDHRMSHPEAYRVQCHWETRDMFAAGVIDEMEKLEMDEQADAAYWHSVEELIVTSDQYLHGAHYDIMPKSGGEQVGRIICNTYYSAEGPGRDGFDGKVVSDKRGRRLIFRHGSEPWAMIGLQLTSSSGEAYDLVQIAQTINGRVYANIDDPDCYRALVDCAQVALESHDFNSFRKARPLLLSANFNKCTACLDRFGLRDDCGTCGGNGFVRKPTHHPNPSA